MGGRTCPAPLHWWGCCSALPSSPGSRSRTGPLSRLVLVGAGSLGRFRPAPSERTLDRFLQYVAVDPDRVRQQRGGRWELFEAQRIDVPARRASRPPTAGCCGSSGCRRSRPATSPSRIDRKRCCPRYTPRSAPSDSPSGVRPLGEDGRRAAFASAGRALAATPADPVLARVSQAVPSRSAISAWPSSSLCALLSAESGA